MHPGNSVSTAIWVMGGSGLGLMLFAAAFLRRWPWLWWRFVIIGGLLDWLNASRLFITSSQAITGMMVAGLILMSVAALRLRTRPAAWYRAMIIGSALVLPSYVRLVEGMHGEQQIGFAVIGILAVVIVASFHTADRR